MSEAQATDSQSCAAEGCPGFASWRHGQWVCVPHAEAHPRAWPVVTQYLLRHRWLLKLLRRVAYMADDEWSGAPQKWRDAAAFLEKYGRPDLVPCVRRHGEREIDERRSRKTWANHVRAVLYDECRKLAEKPPALAAVEDAV